MRAAVLWGILVVLGPLACSSVGEGAAAGPCPESLPVAGTSCDVPKIICEYGSDPRRQCHSFSVCLGASSGDRSATTWRIQTNTCGPLPPVECPATFAAAPDRPCSPKDAWCAYAEGGRCHCTDCRTGPAGTNCSGMPVWRCEDAESNPGCPKFMPRIGSPCAPPGGGVVDCIYGCEWGTATCAGGVWQPGPDACAMAVRKSVATGLVVTTQFGLREQYLRSRPHGEHARAP